MPDDRPTDSESIAAYRAVRPDVPSRSSSQLRSIQLALSRVRGCPARHVFRLNPCSEAIAGLSRTSPNERRSIFKRDVVGSIPTGGSTLTSTNGVHRAQPVHTVVSVVRLRSFLGWFVVPAPRAGRRPRRGSAAPCWCRVVLDTSDQPMISMTVGVGTPSTSSIRRATSRATA